MGIAMTAPEKRVWDILESIGFEVRSKCTDVDPSNSIYYQWKVGKYRLDFALPDAQIAIEVDGHYWHQGVQKINDQIRDNNLRKLGWKILRVSDRRLDKDHIQNSVWHLFDV